MTRDQALADLRAFRIGSETVRQWPEAWQRAAVAEGLIVIADGRVKILEPTMAQTARLPEPVRLADMLETTVRIERVLEGERGELAAPVWQLGGRKCD